MTLLYEEKRNLIKYRIKNADDILEEAEILFSKKKALGTANRIYYSLFNLVNALALKDDFTAKKHTNLKSFFNKEYLYNNVIGKDIGKAFNKAMMYRSDGDYKIIPDFDLEDMKSLLKNAKKLNEEIKKILNIYLKEK
jgi:uncharacterized protein (UPF0332 family)